jgi:hypothetical protein
MRRARYPAAALPAWLRRGAASVAAGALLALPAAGGSAETGLFDDTADIKVVLEFPVRRLLRERDARELLPATLHYHDADGRQVSLPLQVRSRGHTRLRLCDLPPIRLEFDRAQTAGTVFAGQKNLKLVTQCKADRKYRDYVRLEQRIYEAYGLLTPVAFRTRALAVTFVDSAERMTPLAGPAFLIEDDGELAKRNGLGKRRVPGLTPADVDPGQAALLELFQFMIGNTDWSVHLPMDGTDECCHNILVLGPRQGEGRFTLVPYDFDQSGMVDAEYAAVSPGVGVRRVRQRIYRGLCSRNAEVPAAIRRFQELRPRIEATFQGRGLGDFSERRAASYLRSFYDILSDPAQVQERIYAYCRPDPVITSAPAAGGATAPSTSDSSLARLP